MGESMVEAQNIDNKMRESVASRETLGVSVSFGKYENDSLSWEKWSTFSPNKYLDEVGKCSTPGSVAQKKAFFEAHYKKIAAMKAEAEAEAELLNQQKATETGPSRSDDYNQDDIVEIKEEHENGIESKVSVNDEEPQIEISTIDGSGKCENTEETTSVKDESLKDKSMIASNNNGVTIEDAISVKDESFQDESVIELNNNGDNLQDAILVKDENFQDESVIELNNNGDNLQDALLVKDEIFRDESIPVSKVLNLSEKLDEAVLVNDESMKLVKQHFKVDLEHPRQSKQETPKPKAQNVAKKINPTKVEKNVGVIKKKPTTLLPKSPATPTPMVATRSSSKKPNATSSSLSKKADATSSLLSTKKAANATSASSSKKAANATSASSSKSIRTAPMSLHLSMSMNSVTSDTASSVTSSRRRSLFMEQMGDKDIVRRAFKTFQNRINELELPVSDSRIKQVPIKESESKASTSMASQKENERSKKTSEKINPSRGRLGPTKSESSGSLRGVSVDERRSNASSSSVVLRSTERADRRKAFFKNLEEKSNAREAERTQINSKSKEAKEAEIKKLRQNLSFKAKPMPTFYKSQGLSKSTSDKEAVKNGTQRRLDSHR